MIEKDGYELVHIARLGCDRFRKLPRFENFPVEIGEEALAKLLEGYTLKSFSVIYEGMFEFYWENNGDSQLVLTYKRKELNLAASVSIEQAEDLREKYVG